MDHWLQEAVNTADKISTRFFVPKWLRSKVSLTIKLLVDNIERLTEKKNALAEQATRNKVTIEGLRAEVRSAKTIAKRIDQQIAEMTKSKGMMRDEVPAAILMSPYQSQQFLGQCSPKEVKNSEDAWVRTYKSLPVLVMSGVYGPAVVTQKALDGLTRQAPELLTKAL